MSSPAPPAVPVPDLQLARRKLQFFWLVDHSGSMAGQKMAKVNQAIREAIPEVRKAVANHPEIEVFMRAVKFADGADWHVGPAPVPLEQFVWGDLATAGATDTAAALRLLADEMTLEKMPRRGVPPVCILITDGHHTGSPEEYDGAIAQLLRQPWGERAIRIAIGIAGQGSDYNTDEMVKFVSPVVRATLADRGGVLEAHTVAELVHFIRWASTQATLGSVQNPANQADPNAAIQLAPLDPVAGPNTNPF